jgi:hypothetical protein
MRESTPGVVARGEHQMVPLACLPVSIAAAFRRDHATVSEHQVANVPENLLVDWGRSRGELIMHEVLRALVRFAPSPSDAR